MKTLRIIRLALVAVVLSATLVACSDDDDEGGGSSGSTTIKTSTSVNVETPGTLELLLGDKVRTTTSLKITGSINGDDLKCLHQMLRCTHEDVDTRGMLSILDISDVTIIRGGNQKYHSSESFYQYMFDCCEGLEEIAWPRSRDEISAWTFCECIGLKKVIIPDNVTDIDYYAFDYCRSLASLTSLNVVPPTLGTSSGVPTSTCILYVPKGSKEAYSTAEEWEKFQNIVEIGK